jgi:peptidoglycan-N-acetylglucosamine deacetylase
MHSLSFLSGYSGGRWKAALQHPIPWGRIILTLLVVGAYWTPTPSRTPPRAHRQSASLAGSIDVREPSRSTHEDHAAEAHAPEAHAAEALAGTPISSPPVARLPSSRAELLSPTPAPEEPHVLARDVQRELKGVGCDKSPSHDVLGVSRVIDIDTTGGPWLGGPHGDRELLAPGEVVLTFDDGPRSHSTRAILAALAEQCAKATFFMVGDMAAKHPDVVQEVVEQGHTVGTHTWSHLNLRRLPADKMKQQIESAFIGVDKAAGAPVAPFFRYPYLSSSKITIAYLQSRNIAQCAIDIDSLDWRSRNPPSIIHRVMSLLEKRGRGIVLLHDTYPSTAAAVPLLLQELKAKGYKLVHLRPTAAVQALAGFDPPVTDIKHPHILRHAQSHARHTSRSKLMMW